MEFIVREMSSKPDTIYVRYDCACGCKPGVEHRRDSSEVAQEGCCCGNLHFVGPGAREELDRYIASCVRDQEPMSVRHNRDRLWGFPLQGD